MKLFVVFRFFVLFAAVAAFASCDKVETPIEQPADPDGPGGGGPGGNGPFRKVLVESFGGIGCGFCPNADADALILNDSFPEQVIYVTINAGQFADPTLANPTSIDWTTPAGNVYDSIFNSAGLYPNGLVNRSTVITKDTSDRLIAHGTWYSAVNVTHYPAPGASLEIELTYNSGSKSVDISSTVTYLSDLTDPVNIVYYLVEDSLVGPQVTFGFSGNSLKDEYTHRNVLRGSIGEPMGTEISAGDISSGDNATHSTTNFVLDDEWDVSKCAVIAYIYNRETKEIIQAEEQRIL